VARNRSGPKSSPSRPFMATLGVVVYSLSAMTHLARCLDSVQWANRVCVYPLNAPGVGESIVGRFPAGLEMDTDWVLHLWGDERVESGLAAELKRLCQDRLEASPSLYDVPIRSHLLGRWVEGSLWSPAPSPRLHRRVRDFPAHWWERQHGDRQDGAGSLQGWISDYSCTDLQTAIERINVVSSLCAERLRSQGEMPGRGSIALYPARVLLRLLFMKGLFFHGMGGMSLSLLAAYATLLTAMKSRESLSQQAH